MKSEAALSCAGSALIPQRIVRLNRVTILAACLLGAALRMPLVTTVLFLAIAAAALFGRRGSIVYRIGTVLFRNEPAGKDGEDPSLMRFNNALAAILLGAAQPCFFFGASIAGWALVGCVAAAAALALAGFCVGCVLFFRLRLNYAKVFGPTPSPPV